MAKILVGLRLRPIQKRLIPPTPISHSGDEGVRFSGGELRNLPRSVACPLFAFLAFAPGLFSLVCRISFIRSVGGKGAIFGAGLAFWIWDSYLAIWYKVEVPVASASCLLYAILNQSVVDISSSCISGHRQTKGDS